jgi:hypothetical protein
MEVEGNGVKFFPCFFSKFGNFFPTIKGKSTIEYFLFNFIFLSFLKVHTKKNG